jgi:hypothetical protein
VCRGDLFYFYGIGSDKIFTLRGAPREYSESCQKGYRWPRVDGDIHFAPPVLFSHHLLFMHASCGDLAAR